MRRYLFADESGDFNFCRKSNVSRYYIIGAVSVDDCQCGAQLLELRREMIWSGIPVQSYFHASEDTTFVRDEVFRFIQGLDFRFYAQIMEKSKAMPHVRVTNARFYKFGWFYLMKYIADRVAQDKEELMITAASVGTKRGQAVFTAAVNDAISQTTKRQKGSWITAFHPSATDPCLQIADYCIWALRRKWESGGKDTRYYDVIRPRIAHEYDFWAHGNTHYY
jgi:hypothetical protein